MPNQKYHRVIIWVVFLFGSMVIAGQLLYPSDRALPFARIRHQSVAWRDHEQLAKLLDTHFRRSKLKLVVDEDTSVEVPLASAGAELNTDRMIEDAMRYPFWWRFVPFSIIFFGEDATKASVFYTDSVLRKTSQEQASKLSFDPVNARLAIEEGKLVAEAEKWGSKVAADEVYRKISRTQPTLGGATKLITKAKRVEPTETASSLKDIQVAAEAALAREVNILANGQRFAPDNATVASWLQIVTGEDGKPTLQVIDEKINELFDSIDAKAGMPAGRTNINLVNGYEKSRTTGQTGSAVGREELKTQLVSWLLEGQGQSSIEATFYDVAPSVMYDSKYTATEEGLRAYVADAARRMNVHIAVQQVDGGKWSASARSGESIPSASTYKLFVAKWLFDRMDKGLVHWDDPMLDTTVSVCFDRMTIASTNPCAEAWLAQAGRADFNQYIWGLGFSKGTNFNMPVATHSTADDLQRMMLGVHNSTLISGAHKDRLLRSLSTHPYRGGIAAGSGGKVYDKVGYLWDYVHDTAIVQHPKGTYIMTIMTKGQSYATIANLTREIERIMYP